jgi:hypothetical protein
MEPKDKSIREGLLSNLPQPVNLADYRRQVGAMLQKSEKKIRLERMAVTSFWIFCAISATIYLWFDGRPSSLPKGPFLACFMLLWGMTELLKHYINSCRVDLLKEIKQVQVQVLELQSILDDGSLRNV